MRIFGREEKYVRMLDYVVFTILICCGIGGTVLLLFSLQVEPSFVGTVVSTITISLTVYVYILWNKKSLENMREEAKKREIALDYDSAIEIWEYLGEIEEAARVRKLQAEMGSVKVAQKVVHGDEVTEIKDSVLNRSNVGGGTSKMQELEKLTEMKKEGLIDDDEFKQMKKEILGK